MDIYHAATMKSNILINMNTCNNNSINSLFHNFVFLSSPECVNMKGLITLFMFSKTIDCNR